MNLFFLLLKHFSNGSKLNFLWNASEPLVYIFAIALLAMKTGNIDLIFQIAYFKIFFIIIFKPSFSAINLMQSTGEVICNTRTRNKSFFNVSFLAALSMHIPIVLILFILTLFNKSFEFTTFLFQILLAMVASYIFYVIAFIYGSASFHAIRVWGLLGQVTLLTSGIIPVYDYFSSGYENIFLLNPVFFVVNFFKFIEGGYALSYLYLSYLFFGIYFYKTDLVSTGEKFWNLRSL